MDQLAHLQEDQEIDLNVFKSTIGVSREDTIHVNNLPYSYSEKDLRHLFKDCGEITQVSVPEDRTMKQIRGYAFITFDCAKAARKSMNLDGHRIMNRPLRIALA